jgi:hypothetical protein
MRRVSRLSIVWGLAIGLFGLATTGNHAQVSNAAPPAAAQQRMRLTIPAEAGHGMMVEGTDMTVRDGEIRVSGEVTITLPGGVRLQVSQMPVRIVRDKENGTTTIIVEPLPRQQRRRRWGCPI